MATHQKTLMEKLNGYIQIHPDNYEDIDTDLWIKYVTDEGKLKGGGLLVCNRAPLYFVLKSPYTKRSWCVNLEKNSIFIKNEDDKIREMIEKNNLYKLYKEGLVEILDTPKI